MALLVYGKYLLTDPNLGEEGILEDSALFVENDIISEIGDYKVLKEKYPYAKIVGSDKEIVLPGFIDSHSHGWGLTPLQAGSGYDFLEKWVLDLALNINIDPYLNACYSAIKHIESGCTTIHHYHNSKNPQNAENEIANIIKGYKDVGIRFALSLGVRDQNKFTYDDENFFPKLPVGLKEKFSTAMNIDKKQVMEDYFILFDKIFNKYNGDNYKVFFGPMAPQWCSDELLMAIQDRCKYYNNAKIHLHVLQTVLQKAYGLKRYGKSLVSHLYDIGLASPNVTYGHAIWLTSEDMELMADTQTSVTHHASCNLNMRNGIQPLMALKDKGVLVAIGLDDKGINDDEDYIQEMRLIHKLHRVSGFDFDTPKLSAVDIIKMATINASHVTGFSNITGTLKKGKKADMSLVSLINILEPWIDDRISLLEAFIHRAKGTDVQSVIVGGQLVMHNKDFLNINKQELFKEISASASKGLSEDQKKMGILLNELKPYVFNFYKEWFNQEYYPFYFMNSKI